MESHTSTGYDGVSINQRYLRMEVKLHPQWQQYLQLTESDWSLSEMALLVAEHLQSGVERREYTYKIEDMAGILAQRVKTTDSVSLKIEQLNHFFYTEMGFRGNTDDYYNPNNSLLNSVIDTRLGIPITLAILYIRFAEAIGINAYGISFPGHFLMGIDDNDNRFVLDPFEQGQQLDKSRLFELLSKSSMDIETLHDIDDYLVAAPKRWIMIRLLRNLKNVYIEKQEIEKGLTVIELILSLVPEVPDELRDRGMIYYHLDYSQGAMRDLLRFIELQPDSSERNVIESVIESMGQQTTPLH